MPKIKNSKRYDLEDRTYNFALAVNLLCRKIKKDIYIIDYVKQAVRSSSSIGANYIEANESSSKKDFLMRAKICRKEAKETGYWLKLLRNSATINLNTEFNAQIQESEEILKIFSAIIEKCK